MYVSVYIRFIHNVNRTHSANLLPPPVWPGTALSIDAIDWVPMKVQIFSWPELLNNRVSGINGAPKTK